MLKRSGLLAAISVLAAATALTQTKPQAPGVKGTPQLPGDNGKIDQAYTMGTEQQLNFTLRSAEYTLGRLVIGGESYSPSAEQKLLVLKYTIQNPNKAETQYRSDSLKLMVVDSKDVNHEFIQSVAKQDENKQPLDVMLKPGQKVEAVTGIMVPGETSVPKLIVQHYIGGKVLRYDLRGLVKALPAPFADPADKTGATARAQVPADHTSFFPLEHFDVRLVSASLVAEKMGEHECEDGKQFFVVSVMLRNPTNVKHNYRYDTLHARVIAADDEKEEPGENLLLKTARNEDVDADLAPGESYTCRLVISIPKSSKPAKIILSEGESHGFIFDVSDGK